MHIPEVCVCICSTRHQGDHHGAQHQVVMSSSGAVRSDEAPADHEEPTSHADDTVTRTAVMVPAGDMEAEAKPVQIAPEPLQDLPPGRELELGTPKDDELDMHKEAALQRENAEKARLEAKATERIEGHPYEQRLKQSRHKVDGERAKREAAGDDRGAVLSAGQKRGGGSLQSLEGELTELDWEDKHRKALMFAASLTNTKYDVGLPKRQDVSVFPMQAAVATHTASSSSTSPQNTTLNLPTLTHLGVSPKSMSHVGSAGGSKRSSEAPLGRLSSLCSIAIDKDDVTGEPDRSAASPGLFKQRALEGPEERKMRLSLDGDGKKSSPYPNPNPNPNPNLSLDGDGNAMSGRPGSPLLAALPASRPASPSLLADFDSRPWSRHELRVQTPMALEFSNADLDVGELSQRSIESMGSYDSYASVLTTSSLGSSSSQSVIPFPFRLPPGIPQVDSHIPYPAIRYSEIKRGAKNRKLLVGGGANNRRERRERQRQRHAYAGGPAGEPAGDDLNSVGSSSSLLQGSTWGQAPAEVARVMAYFRTVHKSLSPPASRGGDEKGSRKAKRAAEDGQYEISLQDFESAVQRHSRALATIDNERHTCNLLLSLEWLLTTLKITPEDWFKEVDTGGFAYKGNGKLSFVELERGIFALCDRVGMPHWRKTDVAFILREIDPSGDGDVSLSELKFAFAQLRMPPKKLSVLRDAGPVLARVHRCLHANKMKVRDLFDAIDRDHSHTISSSELSAALHRILALQPEETDGAHTRMGLYRATEMVAEAAVTTTSAAGASASSWSSSTAASTASTTAPAPRKASLNPLLHALAVPLIGKGDVSSTILGPRRRRVAKTQSMPETEDNFLSMSKHRGGLDIEQMARIRRSSILAGVAPWKPHVDRPFSRGQPIAGVAKAEIKEIKVKSEPLASAAAVALKNGHDASIANWDSLLKQQLRRLKKC